MTNLEPGDIVRLNSGGPALTVTSVYGENADPHVTAVWFNNENGLEKATFFASMLTPRVLPGRPPIIPNPGETYENAMQRRLQRSTRQ